MRTLNILWICLSCAVQFVFSATKDIQLDATNCGQNINVNEGTKYQVKWDGQKLPSSCNVEFTIPDKDIYKLKVEPDVFEIKDCSFSVSYKYNGRVRSKYGCRSEESISGASFFKVDDFTMIFKNKVQSSSKLEIEVTIVPDEEGKEEFAAEALLGIPAIGILICICLAKKKGVNIFACDCSSEIPDRRESVINHQSTPEPETERTQLPSRTPSVEINLSDMNDVADPMIETPPPSLQEKPPPSYEECIIRENPPPQYRQLLSNISFK